MAFGNNRSVRLAVGATVEGMVGALNRGSAAARQFSSTVAASARTGTQALVKQKEAAESVAKPLAAIGTVAALGIGYAIKAYADFDEKMSSVKSLSHATTDEMNQLKQAALTTGTAIGFSATEAADAEIELVKAGTSAADIYGGALAGSLKLAAAGQIDVADATSIAASTLTQFGLKGKDVTHIADLLAAGADKALGGVSDLGEGLKYIGPVAASSNVSLEQTVGSLALLAQNGILGEQAGTGLRGMLLSLTAPSELASKTMEKYGISVYNAHGKFIGFNGVAEQLKTKLGTLDDAQRNAALGTIFGNAQITTATILMKGGAKEVDKWTKSVDEQGFATEQAVGKMDNLNGDLTKLKASFQTAAIVTGEAADGPLRAAVEVVTDMIDTYSRAPGAVQGVVLGIGALTAGVGLSSAALLVGIPKVVAFGEALKVLALSRIPIASAASATALRGISAFGAGMTGAAVRTAGLSRATRVVVGASAGMGKALAATGSFLTGPWGIALGIGAAAVAGYSVAVGSGAVSQEKLTNAISTSADAMKTLELAGKRSGISNFFVGDVSQDLKDLPKVLRDLGTEGFSAGTALRSVKDYISGANRESIDFTGQLFGLREQAKSLEAYGSALAQVASADAPAASKSFNDLVKSQKLSRDEQSLLLDNMKDYKSALTNQATSLGISASKSNLLLLATGKYAAAAATATDPTKENVDALKQMDTSAEEAAKSIEDTVSALKDLTSPILDARSAERDFQAAVDAVTSTIADNAKAYKDAGTSMDIHTEEGRKNQAALDQIAQSAENAASALYNQTGDQDKATASLSAGREELIKALDQYGITGTAAQRYADKIIGTPKSWATLFANNAPQQGSAVDKYKGKLDAVPKKTRTQLEADKSAAEKNVAALKAKLQSIPGHKNTVLEAQIATAEASITSLKRQLESVPRLLSISAIVKTNTTGLPVDASFASQVGKAGGGPISGPGTGTSDDVPIWASNGEFMMRTAAVRHYGQPFMHALNQGLLSKQQLMAAASMQGLAAGGPVAPARYAPAPAPTIVVQAGGGQSTTFAPTFVSSGDVRKDAGDVMFEYRRLQRGGH